MCKIFKVFSGKEDDIQNLILPENVPGNHKLYIKYAPLTSIDVERYFSMFKNVRAIANL